jgi:hypothetical protein
LNWLVMIPLMLITTSSGWEVAQHHYYKPGDEFGYNMGLVGGVMLLLMLTYPMRKHLTFMSSWGPLKYWFSTHMMLGIIGTALVVFHSTFYIRSVNAAVAITCLVVVAGSGVAGRFIYTHIHRGLYGARLTLKELQADLLGSENEASSRLSDFPRILQMLNEFEKYAINGDFRASTRWQRLLLLSIKQSVVKWRCVQELSLNRPVEIRALKEIIFRYLNRVVVLAQFETFERIFSFWHVLHLPLVYMLTATAVIHVIAVHMY